MNVQSEATDGAQNPLSNNISFDDYINRRSQEISEPEALATEPEDESWEETEESLEPEAVSDEPEESDEEVTEEEEEEEQEIDLLSLNPEQLQALAKKSRSRLLHRVGELTAQKKALEEKLSSQAETKPLPVVPQEENPFRDIESVEGLQAKFAELEKVAEETDNILEEHEDYGAEDIIVVGDREFTKKEIRKANRNAREAMAKYLPAQHAELARREQRVQMEAHYTALIPQEVPEIANEDSELSKQYKALLSDPLVEQVNKLVPDLGPQLPYILAHAVRSIHRSQKPKVAVKAAGVVSKAKVPGTPFGAGAAKSGPKTAKKSADQAYQRFQSSTSVDDWVAARVAKMQKF
jgi:hypothetical protein